MQPVAGRVGPARRMFLVCSVLVIALATARASDARACLFQRAKPAVVAFLLDVSGSVHHFSAFERAWQQIVDEAKDGDTILLAVVKRDATGGPGGDFPFLEQQRMPCYSPVVSPAKYHRERASAIAQLQRAFLTARTLPKPAPQQDRTLLLSSIRSIAKHFANHDGPRLLVLASDGHEDSDRAIFKNTALTDAVISTLVARERTPDLRRQLTKVSTYVVAAGSASDVKALEVQRFWLTYFKELGADLPPERYAGTLLHYAR
jgi:hypothetical protein